MHGPLVVLSRAKGSTGWSLHVGAERVTLEDATLTALGTKVEVKRRGVVTRRGLSQPFTLGGLEVVCFRAEEKSRAQPTPRAMKAIEAVRASDSDDARRVLSDVLEETGALAEAEYVRLELKLQNTSDVSSAAFVNGVKHLRVLSSVVGPTFRYLVGRDIDGCTGVRWAFRCPATWESMQRTTNASERVCTSCKQLVVQVGSEAEAAKLAADGVCAQVRVEEEMWVGEMAAEPDAPARQPMWVGSVAVQRPPERIEPVAPAEPSAPAPAQKKAWWRKLFGR